MRKRLLIALSIVGILVIIVVVIGWFAFPDWKSKPGGLLLLIGSALTGVLATIKGLKDVLDLIDREKKKNKFEDIEKLVVQVISTPLTEQNKKHARPSNVMHNIPQPDYGKFIGREEEIKKIVSLLLPIPHSQYPIVTIDGIGGVGKSALALEVANRYLYNYDRLPIEERFDAIIWTSAKETVLTTEGIKNRPQVLRTLSDIYAAIAVTLQREDITRAQTKDEQDQLIRNALTHQRTLIIVDNLETIDDEKVNTFIREIPYPTKAIITTRHRLDVAYPVRLSGMPKEDALKIIDQECSKKNVTLTDIDANRLFERTAGIPLALVWSIGLMGKYDVETVIEKLGDAEENIAEFCFKAVLESIQKDPAYKLLLALALFATDASREALGSIAKLPIRDRDTGLAHLEILSLVDKQTDRFKLLPLTKTYAMAEFKKHADLGTQISRRWVEYLKSICAGVDSEYFWRYRSYAFIQDGETILDAIQWCKEHGPAEDAIFLTYAAYDFLEVRGRWNEMQILVTDTLGLAESLKADLAIARLCNTLAWILMQQGELEDAETLYIKSLEKYQNQSNQEGETIVLHHLCAIYRKRRQFDKAEEYLQQAENIDRHLEVGDLHALVKTERGKLARDKKDWPEAKRIFTEIAEYFEKRVEQTPRDEPLARGNWGHLAIVAYYLGNYNEAKDLCLKSIEFFESFGTKGYLATLKYRLALAEKALGENKAALAHAEESVDWFERLGMKPDYAEAKKLLDELQLKFGRRRK
jgi:LuxR family glucitol operon transcriptional activator